MMIPNKRRGLRAFSLIELLAVVLIIAVLIGLGAGAGLKAIRQAKMVSALVSAAALESAVNSFVTEYKYLPVRDLDEDATIQSDNQDLILALLGKEAAGSPLNARGIRFLNVKDGKRKGTGGADGLVYDANNKPVGLYDPWGRPFKLRIDGDYDEEITVKVDATNAPAAKILNGRTVAVWSNGEDGAQTKGGSIEDDVKTWN